MKTLIPYPGLTATLQLLKKQVIDSMPFIEDYVPQANNAGQLYNRIKNQVTYFDDPEEVEHIKTVQSLFDEFDGRGDCDDFTVYTLAACAYYGFWPCQVILFGNSRNYPSHICSSVYSGSKGEYIPMDLTAPWFGYLRNYKYYQYLDFYL